MDFLNDLVTLVHIVELEFILIEQHGTHRQRIVACIVEYLGKYHTLHRQVEGLFGGVALDGCHLVEMAKLTSIIGHLNGKLIACAHLLGEVYGRTATIGPDALDQESALAFVLEFIRSGNGLFVAYTSAVYRGVGDNYALSRCREH